MDTAGEIRKFILETFLLGDRSKEIGIDDSFYEKGIVDSTGVLNIINFIEDRFGVRVADEDIVPENFDSVRRIVSYVESKKSAKANI